MMSKNAESAPALPKCCEDSKVNLHKPEPTMRHKMEDLIRTRQRRIIERVEQLDGKKFRIDEWKRADGSGEGVTSVIEDGNVFERGGVNISIVHGRIPEAGVRKMRENHAAVQLVDGEALPFWVCGLSMILHPKNPNAPTVHLNYRYFETQDENGDTQAWWFGGGSDLTPSYLYDDDAVFFHQCLKRTCDKHDKTYYKEFKQWCDRYFVNHHRGESRGIGGIFFDDLVDPNPNKVFEFARDALDGFLPSYIPIVEKRKDMPFTPEMKKWQQLCRGRYVEFNLVHDRGTAFGLHTPGSRVESILVSMPLTAAWSYDYHPEEGSREARLVDVLKHPVDWAAREQHTYKLP